MRDSATEEAASWREDNSAEPLALPSRTEPSQASLQFLTRPPITSSSLPFGAPAIGKGVVNMCGGELFCYTTPLQSLVPVLTCHSIYPSFHPPIGTLLPQYNPVLLVRVRLIAAAVPCGRRMVLALFKGKKKAVDVAKELRGEKSEISLSVSVLICLHTTDTPGFNMT